MIKFAQVLVTTTTVLVQSVCLEMHQVLCWLKIVSSCLFTKGYVAASKHCIPCNVTASLSCWVTG